MESPRESAPPAADASLERAPELLRHVFETSPDCITLTERASGRYVMVNAGFTRITGYSPEEVIGKTSLELGIWVYASDRQPAT